MLISHDVLRALYCRVILSPGSICSQLQLSLVGQMQAEQRCSVLSHCILYVGAALKPLIWGFPWVSINGGVPQTGWFIMEHPIRMIRNG